MPPARSRRSVLGLAATLSAVALGGCTSADRRVDTTTRRTPLSVGDAAEVGDGTVTVDSIRTRRTFVGLLAGVHPEVYGRPDAQYVLVDVLTDGVDDPTRTVRDAASLSLDSTRYDVVDRYLVRNRRKKDATSVAFAVPDSVSANAGEVVWTDESSGREIAWTLPRDVLDALAAPPEFSVESFEVPRTTAKGSPIEARVTVRNDGGTDGTFVAELGSANLSDQSEFRLDVPAGETATHVKRFSLYGDAGSDVTVVLDWGSETSERTVRVES